VSGSTNKHSEATAQNDRMKQNTILITTYLEKNYWEAHSAVDFIFNSVVPEDGPVGPKHVATF
jgi:hypothetical protein